MNRTELTISAIVLAALCLPTMASGQSPDELPPELLACAEETDVAMRLECFDREMAKLRATPGEAAPPAPVAESVPEPAVVETAPVPDPVSETVTEVTAAAPEADVIAPAAERVAAPVAAAPAATAAAGALATVESAPSPSAMPAPEPEPVAGGDFGLPDEGPNEITSKVANIMRRPYGEMVILLDNGQIWEQKHRDSRFRLDIGDDVTISEGLISGYRLTGGSRNNSIQVERLK
ncbi:MAG: hypothetical protein OEM63_08075 [Gammaproteobacteria bacterium]|nr:hypothetical protein [Gammaproteobacteria bacterium]